MNNLLVLNGFIILHGAKEKLLVVEIMIPHLKAAYQTGLEQKKINK